MQYITHYILYIICYGMDIIYPGSPNIEKSKKILFRS